VQSCFLTGDAKGAGWPIATVAKPLRLSCVQLAERRSALYRRGNPVYASDRGSVRRDRREESGTRPFFGGLLAEAVAAKPRAFGRCPSLGTVFPLTE